MVRGRLKGRARGTCCFNESLGRRLIPQLIYVEFGRQLDIDRSPARFVLEAERFGPRKTGDDNPSEQEHKHVLAQA